MKSIFRTIFSACKQPLSTTYDTYNAEASAITSRSFHKGLRYEISKTILPFLQVSTIKNKTKKSVNEQYFSTVSVANSIFQFSFDSSRNYQFKSSAIIGPIIVKCQSIVSRQRELYNQLECIYHSRFFNIGLKFINPTIDASNAVYIVNFWNSVGAFCFGAEMVGVSNHLSFGIQSRLETPDSIYSIGVQRFNSVILSYYKKIARFLECGFEVTNSNGVYKGVIGMKIQSFRSELVANINHSMELNFVWHEKLTERITVSFNGLLSPNDPFEYGIGLNYES